MIDPISGPAYGRRVSERVVAGTLRFPVEKTPCFSLASFPYRLVGALVQTSSDIIGGAASGVTTRLCEGWVWWSRFVRLGFDSGRWRLLKLHRRRPCFREMEASLALLSPALVSWGWRCSLPCVAGSWSPISVLGFFIFVFAVSGWFWWRSSRRRMIDALRWFMVMVCASSSRCWWLMVADEISSLRLMLSDNRSTWFEGVCGDDGVELTSSDVSRWIDRWMFHRGWLEGGRRRGSKRWSTGTAASFSVSRVSLVGLVGLVCVF